MTEARDHGVTAVDGAKEILVALRQQIGLPPGSVFFPRSRLPQPPGS